MLNNTHSLDKFIISRDGELDQEFYDQQYTELRKQIIHEAASKAITAVLDVPLTVGHNLVSLVLGHS